LNPDFQIRLTSDTPCGLRLGRMQEDIREEMRAFLAREHATEATAVNAVYSREHGAMKDTRKIRRAHQQLRSLATLRSLARDRSETGARFRDLYSRTASCEGFSPRRTDGCIAD